MNKTKTVTSALLASGIMLGGFGTSQIASAQDADDATDESTTTDDGAETETDATDGEARTRRGGGDGEGRRGHRGGGCNGEVVAEALGIDVEELQAAREDGSSLAEIAEANGVDPQVVVDALIAETDAKLDAKVEEGSLTEDEAAERLAAKTERIEDRVQGEGSEDRNSEDRNSGERDSDDDDDADEEDGDAEDGDSDDAVSS